jgi:hypothetical protein
MTLGCAKTQLFSILGTTISLGMGLLRMCWPSFWLRRRLSPRSETVVFERVTDGLAYRVDMLSQNILDRPMLRQRWVNALIRTNPPQPMATVVQPVQELHGDAAAAAFLAIRNEFRPVVLRGFMKQSEDWRDWSLDAFLAAYGDEEDLLCCPVRDGYPGRVREIEVPGVYLHNTQVLLQRHPELLQQTGFELLPRTLAKGLRFSGVTQLMLGRGRGGSFWHCAGGLNLFCMLSGRKKWTFINPAESPFLLPMTEGVGRSVYYRAGHGGASELFGEYLEIMGADPTEHRDEVFERIFSRATRYEVELEPGDVMYSPPWWWHDVRNTSEDSIGLATRWIDFSAGRVLNPIFDTAMRMNWGLTRVFTTEAFGQKLVDGQGRCHFERSRVAQDTSVGALARRVRGGAMAQWLDLDPDVDAYYRLHGVERSALGLRQHVSP